ncbi:MAG: tRNA preQ1(34) S-adenosylmethionine ribosyltransferase-isomerase QueA [Polyangiales bacterium]
MRTDELDYDLPDDLIATDPPADRDGGRLMVLARHRGEREHRAVRDLPTLLPPNGVVVLNDTRVLRARLRGKKPSGGQVEFLLVRALNDAATRWRAMARASKPLRDGTTAHIDDALAVKILGRDEEGLFLVELLTDDPWAAMERCGEIPLPPYMRRRPDEGDAQRYQTVFAARPGAVAAPTAGLHITSVLLEDLQRRGLRVARITLHVGPGTFLPVTVSDLDAHPMHAEWYEVPGETADLLRRAKAAGDPVIAVGTTVVRTLESWGLDGPTHGETRLLIQPGYTFRVVDALLTNLHLPRSTLLALVMAFGGVAPVREAYAEAVRARYRFFSYGDAMLLR